MSKLVEWLDSNLVKYKHGSVPLRDIGSAFRSSLTAREAASWPRWRIEAELSGAITAKGRRDQPRKYVVGYEWPAAAQVRLREEAAFEEMRREKAEKARAIEEIRQNNKTALLAAQAAVEQKQKHLAAMRSDSLSKKQALNTAVAQQYNCISRYFEYAPGESVPYEVIVRRLEELFPAADYPERDYRPLESADIGILLQSYCYGRFADPDRFRDHRWCPQMLFADGRLKRDWEIKEDGGWLGDSNFVDPGPTHREFLEWKRVKGLYDGRPTPPEALRAPDDLS